MKDKQKIYKLLFKKHRNGRHKETNRKEPGTTLTASEKNMLENAIKQANETHKTGKPAEIEYRCS